MRKDEVKKRKIYFLDANRVTNTSKKKENQTVCMRKSAAKHTGNEK